MPEFRKVTAGDGLVIPADDYNAMIDAARDHRRRSGAGDRSGFLGFGVDPSNTVLVKNVTYVPGVGALTLPPFSVLAVNVPTFPPVIDPRLHPHDFRRRPVFNGDVPAASETAENNDAIVVTIDPLLPGQIGRAVAAGVVPVNFTLRDPHHRHLIPVPGDPSKMQSACDGPARLLWPPNPAANPPGGVWVPGVALLGPDHCRATVQFDPGTAATPDVGPEPLFTVTNTASGLVGVTSCLIPADTGAIEIDFGLTASFDLNVLNAGTPDPDGCVLVQATVTLSSSGPAPLVGGGFMAGAPVLSGQWKKNTGANYFTFGDVDFLGTFNSNPVATLRPGFTGQGIGFRKYDPGRAFAGTPPALYLTLCVGWQNTASLPGRLRVRGIGTGDTWLFWRRVCCELPPVGSTPSVVTIPSTPPLDMTLAPFSAADMPGGGVGPRQVTVVGKVNNGTANYTYTIDWGDGSTTTFPPTAATSMTLSHTYAAAAGVCTVVFSAVDGASVAGSANLGPYDVT